MKKRYIPLIVLGVLMALFYGFGLGEYLTFHELKKHREILVGWVEGYPTVAPLAFMAFYALATALSIPGGIFLSIFGGFLFPQPFATLYIVIGATLGAIFIFLAAKTALGDTLRKKAAPFFNKMQEGFRSNAPSYLLFLRFVPLFPFWLVNLAPAFFNVRLSTFAWTTFVGIIPGAFVYAQAGSGLGAILDTGDTFSVDSIFNWDVKIALFALGLFSLLPIIIKQIRRKND